MRPGDPRYRHLYTAFAALECLGFGGLIFGWGSLLYVLKEEGLYLDLCDQVNATASFHDGNNSTTTPVPITTENPPGECDARDARLALVFTVGSAFFAIFGFLLGQINFRFGTRVTRLTASTLLIMGTLLIAFTSNDIPWLIFPGLSLMGGGGVACMITNPQISLLYTTGGSMAVGLIAGSFDTSSGIMLLVKFGFEAGISRKISFLIISGSHLLTLISTFFFLPKDFIRKLPPSHSFNVLPPTADDITKNDPDEKKNTVEILPIKPIELPTLKSCMMSSAYILNVVWVSILQLRFYFLLASLNTIMNDRLPTKDDVSFYTNVQMYVLMCGIFFSPIAGIVFDSQITRFKDRGSERQRTLLPTILPLTVTSLLCLCMSGAILVTRAEALYFVFGFLVVYRSFLYTMAAGFISTIFPNEYYGFMYGVQLLISGAVSLLQYALFKWGEMTDFEQVNTFMLILVVGSFVHPFYQWRASKTAGKGEKAGDGTI